MPYICTGWSLAPVQKYLLRQLSVLPVSSILSFSLFSFLITSQHHIHTTSHTTHNHKKKISSTFLFHKNHNHTTFTNHNHTAFTMTSLKYYTRITYTSTKNQHWKKLRLKHEPGPPARRSSMPTPAWHPPLLPSAAPRAGAPRPPRCPPLFPSVAPLVGEVATRHGPMRRGGLPPPRWPWPPTPASSAFSRSSSCREKKMGKDLKKKR
jgi:hypothetical protein